jgi:hypothetical protein
MDEDIYAQEDGSPSDVQVPEDQVTPQTPDMELPPAEIHPDDPYSDSEAEQQVNPFVQPLKDAMGDPPDPDDPYSDTDTDKWDALDPDPANDPIFGPGHLGTPDPAEIIHDGEESN